MKSLIHAKPKDTYSKPQTSIKVIDGISDNKHSDEDILPDSNIVNTMMLPKSTGFERIDPVT